MNGEVLIFSDIHLYCHKRKAERLEDCLRALDWVFDTAEERKIENILFGGDLFHDRHKIDVYTYQRTFETLEKRMKGNKFLLYLLLGNHDLWFNDKTTVSSVVPLSALPGVRIISSPERLNICGCNWDFVPFTHNPVETLGVLQKLPGEPEYALGHIALDGAILHGSHQADVVIEHDGDMITVSASLFDKYKHVFLGHYHAEQRVTPTVEYVGSPLELSFGEAFQTKHIIAFDGKKNKRKYIRNEFSPKHLVIRPEDRDKYDLENNFVQIKVDSLGATDLISMRKEILEKTNLGSLEIKLQKKKMEEKVIRDAKAILLKGNEMLGRWVDEVGCPDKLGREKLIKIGQKICQKD